MSTSTAAAVLAKIAGLSAAGKATVGVVIAAGVVGVAASAPAIADQFTGSATAPVPGVTSSADASESADAVETEKPEATETPEASETPEARETETARPLPTDLPSAAAFGQSVAADARDGGVDGPQIAARAHERNDLRKDAASPEPTETADATESADVHAPRVLPTAVPTAAVDSHH
ncbi:MAG: hypothetical protein BGO38_17725 [Cellulomonas sp. 73-145]|uniref:hypothetical protein n=1 Tax=Cellulomonas sp. 73-145 TaxID=1895739 RepID=UPI00092BB555|nr:hypothetical protein [Cellulomonas sp. 73-145]OJV59108.1 MAG: hypothetical protein BGO38_17725 [Cellulomonas sp. 73-145]